MQINFELGLWEIYALIHGLCFFFSLCFVHYLWLRNTEIDKHSGGRRCKSKSQWDNTFVGYSYTIDDYREKLGTFLMWSLFLGPVMYSIVIILTVFYSLETLASTILFPNN